MENIFWEKSGRRFLGEKSGKNVIGKKVGKGFLEEEWKGDFLVGEKWKNLGSRGEK